MIWPTATLGELGRVNTGSTPKTSDSRFWNGNIPFVTPAELGVSAPIISAKRYLSDSGAQISRVAPAAAVLVCCIGSLGKTGMAGRAIVPNQQINWVEFDQSLIWPRYGYYACNQLEHQLEASSASTTLPIVNKSKFSELTIPVPPLDVQQRIAAILDKADGLRRKRKRAIELLESLTPSIFFSMFGDPIRSSGSKVTVAEVAECTQIGPFGSILHRKDYQAGGVPLINPMHINGGLLTPSDEVAISLEKYRELKAYHLHLGDVVMARRGEMGRCAEVVSSDKLLCGTGSLFIRPDRAKVSPTFLQALLSSAPSVAYLEQAAAGVTMANLNKSVVDQLAFTVPALDAQARFVAAREQTIKQIELAAGVKRAADSLFSTLQSRAFSGQL